MQQSKVCFCKNLILVLFLFALNCRENYEIPNWSERIPKTFFALVEKLPQGFQGQTDYDLKLPSWFLMEKPKKTLKTETIELGRLLFYDPVLSEDFSVACASCHKQNLSFADSTAVSTGVHGRNGKRNSMPLVNLLWDKEFFWDGRAKGLNQQVLMPIEDYNEMNLRISEAIFRLNRHPLYPTLFERAFGSREVTREFLAEALASFVQSLVSYNSPFDYFHAHEEHRLTAEQIPAKLRPLWAVFRKAVTADAKVTNVCLSCHGPALRSGQLAFDDVGLDEQPDAGYGAVTAKVYDNGKFKTTSLRNIEVTAPYMHDGRMQTLRDVVEHYNTKIKNSKNLSAHLRENGLPLKLNWNKKIIDAVSELWPMLTDKDFLTNPNFSSPF